MRSFNLLLAASIAHHFGSGGQRPLRTAAFRIGIFAAAAFGLGLLIIKLTADLPFVKLPDASLLAVAVAGATQACVAFSLLVASGVTMAGKRESFVNLLLIWPIGPNWRWLLFMVPNVVLGALSMLLVGPPVAFIAQKLDLGWGPVAIGLLLGYVSAYGLVKNPLPKFPPLLYVWVPAVIALEYDLVMSVIDFMAPLPARAVSAAICVCVMMALFFVALSGRSDMRGLVTGRKSHGKVKLILPRQIWFATKLVRRNAFRASFVIALLLSLGLSVAIAKYKLNNLDMLSFAMAMFAASVATDIRSVSRKHNPAEITAAQGTRKFICANIAAAAAIGLVIALPVLIAAKSVLSSATPEIVLNVALQLILGILAGVLAATLLVPQGRDISSQFVANMLVITILFALPQIPLVADLRLWQHNIVDIFVCLMIIVLIYAIEMKRNNYEWRKIYAG